MRDLSIEIIRKCNNNCIHCSSSSRADSSEYIPLSVVARIAKELSKLNIGRVCLSGGEPLLHPDLASIISLFSEDGCVVSLYTSGIVGDASEPRSCSPQRFKELRSCGLNEVIFNMPASSSDVYDVVTGTVGRFPLFRKSVWAAGLSGLSCEGHFVPMKPNRSQLESTILLAKKLGLRKLSFLRLVPHGRAVENLCEIALSSEEDRQLMEDLSSLAAEYPNYVRLGIPFLPLSRKHLCHAFSGKVYVRYDGAVFGCEAFKHMEITSSSGESLEPLTIFDCSLQHALQNSKHAAECRKIASDDLLVQKEGLSCPVQCALEINQEVQYDARERKIQH